MTIQEFADKLAEAWSDISEKLEVLAETLRKAFDEAYKKIVENKRLLCRPPKWYIKANTPSVLATRKKTVSLPEQLLESVIL